MARNMMAAGLWTLTGAFAFGQAAGSLTFEVASVKPSAPLPATGGIYLGPARGGPGTADPEQITWSYATLKGLLMKAYDVKPYQVSGPGWLDSERYDIVAKVAAGVTREQVNGMWQSLLAERFGLVLHHESKEIQVEELVVAKGGAKLKETAEDDPNFWGPPKMSKDGKLNSPGMVNRMIQGPSGLSIHSTAKAQPLSRLTVLLGSQVNRPVVDKTGLTGKYDFELEFVTHTGSLPVPPRQPGAPEAGPGPADVDIERGPDLMTALQRQLGLRLVSSKATIDILVVDKANKVPTAN